MKFASRKNAALRARPAKRHKIQDFQLMNFAMEIATRLLRFSADRNALADAQKNILKGISEAPVPVAANAFLASSF